jgi:hypothetical protein
VRILEIYSRISKSSSHPPVRGIYPCRSSGCSCPFSEFVVLPAPPSRPYRSPSPDFRLLQCWRKPVLPRSSLPLTSISVGYRSFRDFGFTCLQPLYLLPEVLHPLDPCPDLSLSPFRPQVSRLLLFFARRLPPLNTLFAFFIISLVALCTFLFSDMNWLAARGDFLCTWIVFPGFPFSFGPSRPFPESYRLFFSNYHPKWS